MSDKGFYYNIHGDEIHNMARICAIFEIIKLGGIIKDTKVFKAKCNFPCEPDIFFELEETHHVGARKVTFKNLYVMEIETVATNQSRKLKYEQYKGSLAGLKDLIVIDLDKEYTHWAHIQEEHDMVHYRWDLLRSYIRERLPG